MSFSEAVKDGFDHYAKFDGRASRPSFWWWVLFAFIVWIAASILDAAIDATIFSIIVSLGLILPNLSKSHQKAPRHRSHRLVDPDRADPADRVHRAADLLFGEGDPADNEYGPPPADASRAVAA